MESVKKGQLDLIVLRYMARRVLFTLRTRESDGSAGAPLKYALTESHNRMHRMILYHPQALLDGSSCSFVGFVSGRQSGIESALYHELQQADTKMLSLLEHIPELLGYTSLELRQDRWFNLVIFRSEDVKFHVKHMPAHYYAAYRLAPRAYAWIRIHHGLLPAGLSGGSFLLQKTKYYTYHQESQSLVVDELHY